MITSGCVYKFDDLRRWYCQHVIFKINTYEEHNALEGVDQGARSDNCESLKTELPDDECRCAAYLFHYVNEHKRVIVKNLLINWSPDAAEGKVRSRRAHMRDERRLNNLCAYRRKSCIRSPLTRSGLSLRESMWSSR